MKTNLNSLAKECHLTAKSKGWYDKGERNIGELLMLVVTELAEAMEEIRKGYKPNEIYFNDTIDPDKIPTSNPVKWFSRKPEGFSVEIIDCLIRIFDLCGYLGIDLDKAYKIKTEYNKTRSYRHGNKKS